MKRIRIKGLVRLMNYARKQMTSGILESDVQAFQQMILDAIDFVEELCRVNNVALSDLPTPSRRAYEYFKRIDLDNLPIRTQSDAKPVSSLRISGIVASCRYIQREFADLARTQVASSNERDLKERLSTLHEYVIGLAVMVDEICEKVSASPDLLPDPTRRAYQWLKFLSDQANFQDHFQTLTRICHRVPEGHVELYNMAGLYRKRTKKGVRHITINEAFLRAPRSVIKDLADAVIAKKRVASNSRIQHFVAHEDFRETLLAIEMIGVQIEKKTRGEVYDLGEVFNRVNDRYFQGRMEQPILTWNKIITHTKFGHYVPATDTIMISIALDTKDVPSYVLDHVMHHELLHKKLGTKIVRGRRLAHTPEFREEEQSFEHYQKAQAFLGKLSHERQSY
jgi:hypothetical protein